MKTNVESLKALYVKLGGNLTDYYSDIAGGIPVSEYDLISDCILACAKKASEGGGSDLPKPGTSGNVPTSNGTAWVSAPLPKDTFLITAEVDMDNGTVSNLSASASAVWDAISDGKTPYMIADVDGMYLGFAFLFAETRNKCEFGVKADDGVYHKVSISGDTGTYESIDPKDPLVVSGTWADGSGSDPSTVTITTPLADIYNAAETGRTVYLEYANDGITTRLGLIIRALDNGAYSLGFSGTIMASSTVGAIVVVAFANSLVGTAQSAVTGQ